MKDEIVKLSHKYANMNGRINGKWKKVEISHVPFRNITDIYVNMRYINHIKY